MITTRILDITETRAAHSLFRATLHRGPSPDELWELVIPGYRADRSFGAFDSSLDGELVGTAMSFPMPMTVPGGGVAPMAAVTRVGVRADRTRRGILTGLMRAQLDGLAAHGEVFASLRASESGIYGRFGYGVATRARNLEVDLWRTGVRPGAPAGGEVRVLTPDRAGEVLPALYDRIGRARPGAGDRPPYWWDLVLQVGPSAAPGEHLVVAVHTGPGGDDGFVLHAPVTEGEDRILDVRDIWAADANAHAGLWRYLLGADLVRRVRAELQPPDDPLDLLLTDPRALRVTSLDDEVWLRLVDVPAALVARSYGDAEPVVLQVHDAVLPANAGCYRIGPDGAAPTTDAPHLELDVAELARLYLGDRPASALAAAGLLTVHDPAAPARADVLLAADQIPWCGTYF